MQLNEPLPPSAYLPLFEFAASDTLWILLHWTKCFLVSVVFWLKLKTSYKNR